MRPNASNSGFTLAELAVVLAVIAVVLSMAVPSTQRWLHDQDSASVARTVAGAFKIARTDALRSGRNQVVFFGIGGATDTAGNPLLDTNGNPAAVVILDDGPTGSAGQNCRIDPGENTRVVESVQYLSWGFSKSGGTKAPGDLNAGASTSGSSFLTPAGGATTWVMFRPDGTPVAFDAGCNTGAIGSGNGAIYFTNGTRDQAIVLGALGGSRVHTWNEQTGQWTN